MVGESCSILHSNGCVDLNIISVVNYLPVNSSGLSSLPLLLHLIRLISFCIFFYMHTTSVFIVFTSTISHSNRFNSSYM